MKGNSWEIPEVTNEAVPVVTGAMGPTRRMRWGFVTAIARASEMSPPGVTWQTSNLANKYR